MSTFLGALVARAVASTVLADETYVIAGGVRYRTDATRADTVEEDEDGATMHRIVIRFPSEDLPVAIGRGTKVEMGGKAYTAIYAHLLEDVWQVGLTAYGGLDARP